MIALQTEIDIVLDGLKEAALSVLRKGQYARSVVV